MNWAEFFWMGGYAFYVWGSYLIALLALGGEVVFLLRRRKLVLTRTHQRSKLRS
jgi:heme exporter protein D